MSEELRDIDKRNLAYAARHFPEGKPLPARTPTGLTPDRVRAAQKAKQHRRSAAKAARRARRHNRR